MSNNETDTKSTSIVNNNNKVRDEIMAATCAGFITTIVGHPLDTLKVHLQSSSLSNSSSSSSTRYSSWSSWKTFQSLWKQNILFRGIGPPLWNAIIMNTVMFTVFHQIKDSSIFGGAEQEQKENHSFTTNTTDNSNRSFSSSLLAGLVSGFATACVSTPTDYIKIQTQLYDGVIVNDSNNDNDGRTKSNNNRNSRSSNSKSKLDQSKPSAQKTKNSISSWNVIQRLIQVATIQQQQQQQKVTQSQKLPRTKWSAGAATVSSVITTLYRGHIVNLVREGVFTMVYLGIFDYCIIMMNPSISTSSSSSSQATTPQATIDDDVGEYGAQSQQPPSSSPPPNSLLQVAMVSSMTGALAWIVSYPFDTIKTVMQQQQQQQSKSHHHPKVATTTYNDVIRSIYYNNNNNDKNSTSRRSGGGMSEFFRGCVPSTGRAVLVTSLRMITYNFVLQQLQQQQQQQQQQR